MNVSVNFLKGSEDVDWGNFPDTLNYIELDHVDSIVGQNPKLVPDFFEVGVKGIKLLGTYRHEIKFDSIFFT